MYVWLVLKICGKIEWGHNILTSRQCQPLISIYLDLKIFTAKILAIKKNHANLFHSENVWKSYYDDLMVGPKDFKFHTHTLANTTNIETSFGNRQSKMNINKILTWNKYYSNCIIHTIFLSWLIFYAKKKRCEMTCYGCLLLWFFKCLYY